MLIAFLNNDAIVIEAIFSAHDGKKRDTSGIESHKAHKGCHTSHFTLRRRLPHI